MRMSQQLLAMQMLTVSVLDCTEGMGQQMLALPSLQFVLATCVQSTTAHELSGRSFRSRWLERVGYFPPHGSSVYSEGYSTVIGGSGCAAP